MTEKSLILNISNRKSSKKHIPSVIQADTLFTFMSQLDYLIQALKNSMLSPRYCEEDVQYLNINPITKIAIPMKCFCDINMHKLEIHLEWYGYYGLAFSKAWGMKQGIQPVQYINKSSKLCKDFKVAFLSALESTGKNKTQEKLQNYMLHELFYYKPYDGMMQNRETKKICKKCFTDECEWRFVPDVTKEGFQQIYYNETILNAGILNELSNAMAGKSTISLTFKYDDLKYIIVKTQQDYEKLSKEILSFKIEEAMKYQLISKIIIWDISKGDF